MNFEKVLKDVIDGVSNTYGEEFFNNITRSLAQAVDADFCFIGRIDPQHTYSRTISTFAHGQHVDNFEYALQDTPCAEVTSHGIDIYPEDVALTFPKDIMLKDMEIEAYIGTSLKNRDGVVIGLVVALFHNKISDPEPIHTLYKIFSGRISAEIDREDKTRQLQELNESLEQTIKVRTSELEQAMLHLVEQEKHSSLATLIAGIAHELNTPLGVSLSASSMAEESINNIIAATSSDSLTQDYFNTQITSSAKAVKIVQDNLDRAFSLINSFKKVSVEQANLDISTFSLHDAVQTLIGSLEPEIKKYRIVISNKIPDSISITSYAGDYFQVFSNLILNVLQHAFNPQQKGSITLSASICDNSLSIEVKDDGKGMEDTVVNKVFDPFYTTKRAEGGTGLGLNIVYNIITQKLKGRINVTSIPDIGTSFLINLPYSSSQ